MKPQADRIFRKAFNRHFTNHHANFPPSRPISIGDFGVIENNYIKVIGNIKSIYGIDYDILNDDSPTIEEFNSSDSVSISFTGKGELKPSGSIAAKACVDISFSSESSFFFSAGEVSYNSMKDIVLIGERIIKLYKEKKWKKEYVLITNLLQAKRTVLVISGASESSISIEAQSDSVLKLKLHDLSAKIDFGSSSKVAYKIIGDDILQIGMGLSKVYNPIFQEPVIKTRGFKNALEQIDNTDTVIFGNIDLSKEVV